MNAGKRRPDREPGGSIETTPDMEQPKQFILREKILEMIAYALPVLDNFPRKDRTLSSRMRTYIFDMLELVEKVEIKHSKKTAVDELDIKLQILRDLIVLASDRRFYGTKHQPPMTIQQRDVWGRFNKDIGNLIGGYKRSLYQGQK